MANMRHVYTNLVGTARLQLHTHMGMSPETGQHPIMTHRISAPLVIFITTIHNSHTGTVRRVPVDGGIYRTTTGHDPAHDGLVFAIHRFVCQLRGQ